MAHRVVLKRANRKLIMHGPYTFLVFENGRLVKTMHTISGGDGGLRTVGVRLVALTGSYQAKMAQATASTRAFGSNVLLAAQKTKGGLGAAFTTVGLAAAVFGAGIAFALKHANDAAREFESSFAGVRKTVRATEEEYAALADALRELATEIPVNVNELNRLAEAAGQLGVHKDSIIDFVRTVAMLGVTTNMGDEAATSMARFAEIMQMAQDEYDRLGSTTVALGNNLATTESEIFDFGLRLAGAGKIAGFTEANVLSIGGAFSSVGVQAEAGGTAAQKVLLSITDAVNSGGRMLRKYAATANMSAKDFAEAWRSDPAAAFVAFVEGLGASGQEAMGILKDLGLTDQRLIRSFLSLAGAGGTLSEAIDLGNAAWEENNALQKEAEQRFQTTDSKAELAKNELNDLAITIGSVTKILHEGAITAFGTFVGIVNDLPGPLKVVAALLIALVGTFALVGGGALLLLPRIAALKLAMAQLGIQGGLMRGSLSATAGFLTGPWGVAIAAATVGLGLWTNAKMVAEQRTQEFVAAIEADSAAVGGNTIAVGANTRALVANRLEKAGLLELAAKAGISGSSMVDAILGEGDALEQVTGAWKRYRQEVGDEFNDVSYDEYRRLLDFLDSETVAFEEAGAAALRKAQATEEDAGATDEAAAALEAFGEAGERAGKRASGPMREFNKELKEAKTSADQLSIALDYLTGGAIDSEKAALSWLNTLASLQAAIKDNGNTLDKNTEKGRSNREAILSSVDAAFAHAQAIADETGSVKRGTKVFEDHVQQLLATAGAAGLSKDEVHKYLEELKLTPKDVRTMLKLLGVDKAKNDLEGITAGLNNLPNQKTIDILIRQLGDPGGGGRVEVDHAGGSVGSGAARYGSALRSDEVAAILQRGEWVLSRGQVASLGSLLSGMSSIGSGAGGPGAGSESAPFIGSFELDGKRVTKTVELHKGHNKILLGGRPK